MLVAASKTSDWVVASSTVSCGEVPDSCDVEAAGETTGDAGTVEVTVATRDDAAQPAPVVLASGLVENV